MERFQALSWMAFSLFVGALFLGLRSLDTPVFEINASLYLLAAFMFFLRLKFALDDHFYFGVSLMKRWQSQAGLIFAIISWFLQIFAAYSLQYPADSYVLLLTAIGVSTLWIVITGIREGFYREQKYWLATNALYMSGLGILIWSLRMQPRNDSKLFQLAQWERFPDLVLLIMVGIVAFDFIRSRSIEAGRG